MKLFKVLAMVAALTGASLTLSSCRESDTENAVEDAGEAVEESTESAADAAEEVVEDAGDAAEDAAE